MMHGVSISNDWMGRHSSFYGDLFHEAFAFVVGSVHRAGALISGGLIGDAALPNLKTAYCVPGSCLRMPHPAGHTKLS